MNRKLFSIDSIGSWLLILLGLSIPLSVAVTNVLAGLIVLLWLIRGKYTETWELIKKSNVAIAVLIFFFLHILGLLWTEDMSWGLKIIKKEWIFLLLPVMMVFVKKAHIRYYISAYLLAITISEISSYLIWFKVVPPFLKATLYDPTPFMDHITYNPFLAIAIYIVGYYLVFDKTISRIEKVFLAIFFITMSINMFITGGRAGQVGYLIIVTILFFQYFNKNMIKALFVSVMVLSAVLFTAYHSSTLFHNRVNLAMQEIKDFDKTSQGSVGIRLNWGLNTIALIKEHPWIGVGTGDYKQRYKAISEKRTPKLELTEHPHNMYLLEMAQFGILGLLSLLAILYSQISFSLQAHDDFRKKMGITLPLLFMIIMLSDSYLLGHSTTMLFMFFSAFLYRPFDANSE